VIWYTTGMSRLKIKIVLPSTPTYCTFSLPLMFSYQNPFDSAPRWIATVFGNGPDCNILHMKFGYFIATALCKHTFVLWFVMAVAVFQLLFYTPVSHLELPVSCSSPLYPRLSRKFCCLFPSQISFPKFCVCAYIYIYIYKTYIISGVHKFRTTKFCVRPVELAWFLRAVA